ncbi:hypothetical protein ACVWZV_002202 [Bradyrhizobium sp. GM5.1]
MSEAYSNREIDQKFKEVHTRFDNQDKTLSEIFNQVIFTNGKVRKIIIALVLLAGIVIGQSFSNTHDIIASFAGIFSI